VKTGHNIHVPFHICSWKVKL